MKIFFRYLFVRLLVPFMVTLFACTVIWIMVDLYGNINDFLSHKIHFAKIIYFYLLQIPSMLVQVLPATMLFSTLWTLLALNRRSELVALQAGGMAPMWIFSPFFLFAAIWALILGWDLNGAAAQAELARDRLLQQVKGQDAKRGVFLNLPYIDNSRHVVWFFQSLDTNQGVAEKVEVLQRDALGHDMWKDFAREAKWKDGVWQLTGVLEIVFAPDGSVQSQKTYEQKDVDIATPPSQLSLTVSEPDHLTVAQLSQYINTSDSSQTKIAQYRTEWWYRVLHPISLFVLLLFGLQQGLRTDRRSAVVGVVVAIVVLVLYILVAYIFIAAGSHNRMPPFVAVMATPVIFGLIGLQLLALNNGWWWQLSQWRKKRSAQAALKSATR